jgi:hypothetical protein
MMDRWRHKAGEQSSRLDRETTPLPLLRPLGAPTPDRCFRRDSATSACPDLFAAGWVADARVSRGLHRKVRRQSVRVSIRSPCQLPVLATGKGRPHLARASIQPARRSNKLGAMRPAEDQFGLRLAAKAADREEAARQERPAFEERLTQLGYGPRGIAHAFNTLSGPGTVAEVLAVLKDMSRAQSPAIALSFEATEIRTGHSAASRVTITSVERDDTGIRVNYDMVPPLVPGSHGPRGEAIDDLGNQYDNLGSAFGLARGGWRGVLTMPLPPPAATMFRIRITWDASLPSTHQGPAHEIHVSLPA